MKAIFEKQEFNQQAVNEEDYVKMFSDLGFEAKKVEVCFTNGCSAYISLNVNVLNKNKMYAEIFIYKGKASIKVRVSDHSSNLETICNGVSGNKMSFESFKILVENNVIN